MLAVTMPGNSRIEVKDLPMPELEPGEVLLKIGASAICGSEEVDDDRVGCVDTWLPSRFTGRGA